MKKKKSLAKLYLLTLKEKKKVVTTRVAFASMHFVIIVLIKLSFLQAVM